ncbi:CDP-diacylglycerol--glycerol-3-phosphate 3-phosphatidyltransferase, mitochondrial, partial [Geodia barretti]
VLCSTTCVTQVECLGSALSDGARPHLRCSVLLDCLRGTRGHPNSVSLLRPLLSGPHGDRFSLHLYHTPNLRGLLRKVFPARLNEGMGLQHTKIYVFDDSLLLSGANLSRDYFTNRQDRYMLFSDSTRLADYFSRVAQTIADHSYCVGSDEELRPALEFDHLTSRANSVKYRRIISDSVRNLLRSEQSINCQSNSGSGGTRREILPCSPSSRWGNTEYGRRKRRQSDSWLGCRQERDCVSPRATSTCHLATSRPCWELEETYLYWLPLLRHLVSLGLGV